MPLSGGLDDLRGEPLVDPQPSAGRQAAHPAVQDLQPRPVRTGRRPAAGPVHQGEQLRPGDPELHHRVPGAPQILHRVLRVRVELRPLALQELRVSVLGDGLQQAVLVAEEPVDRGWLHPGRGSDRAGAHRVRAALLQQLDGGFDDAAAGVGGGAVGGSRAGS
ncbi:hypothetical protein GCM10020256_48240 [Streptomyces thermocoprophilus]